MREGTLALLLAGGVLAVGVPLVVWQATKPDSPPPVVDVTPSPSMPAWFDVEQVPVDGLYYNCITYQGRGLSCDWDHPLIGPLDMSKLEGSPSGVR